MTAIELNSIILTIPQSTISRNKLYSFFAFSLSWILYKVWALFTIRLSPQLWAIAQGLLRGSILTHGQRMVAAILRVVVLGAEKHFVSRGQPDAL
jgi:hypothetical protein